MPRHPEDSYRLIYKISVAHGNSAKDIDIARGVDAATVKSWLHALPAFDLARRSAPEEFGPPPLPNDDARSKECEDYYDANLDPKERDTLHALLDLGVNPFEASAAPLKAHRAQLPLASEVPKDIIDHRSPKWMDGNPPFARIRSVCSQTKRLGVLKGEFLEPRSYVVATLGTLAGCEVSLPAFHVHPIL